MNLNQNLTEPSDSLGVKFVKMLIGIVVVTTVGSIIAGESFLMLVFFSILCTFGAGLFLWIPLCLGVGSIIYRAISKSKLSQISSNDPSTKSVSTPPATYTANQVAIIRYIQDARHAGMSDTAIQQELTNVGWPSEDINTAFSSFNS